MMRTVEIVLVIIIITGAFIIASFFAVLPWPRQVSPSNLKRLSLTTLQTLDANFDLSQTVFKSRDDPSWNNLQIALSACLPPNMVYNLTVYEVSSTGHDLYRAVASISNAENLGVSTEVASYLVASSNVTFSVIPEKVGERGGGGTLYILNCSDANGWWITGYTAQKLAEDLYTLLSPYFQVSIMVQNTTQFGQVLNGTKISSSPYENVTNAIIINTFGEAVPIPAGSYASEGSADNYAKYYYNLGQKVRECNLTWVSIVGYPLYYVSNTALFSDTQNSWGVYGMKCVGPAGLNAFLQGIDGQSYVPNGSPITGDPGDDARLANVSLSSNAAYYCNYYGLYPSSCHTATRALPYSITSAYRLNVTTYVFDRVGDWLAGAVYRHWTVEGGVTKYTGSLFALGLTRTPDIRLTALGILSDYKPRLYRSEYTVVGTSRLAVLQLGEVGGIA